ncbi:LPS-assembly protein LptD [Aporhodopirellula aestuarii]|uniref:Organic solvent tolerance protein OstA n=1 Tax=Aporhodopirellula aestuarii TaxID=2950107 RepID=A0ABT0TY70_9BACT|nr:organic solvent tolerance protein OstA [Aporhodopirellula aestuarii]MCM2369541.1 organic solvent tolerance protein OstA [Aporhodopirellula aestuarii]
MATAVNRTEPPTHFNPKKNLVGARVFAAPQLRRDAVRIVMLVAIGLTLGERVSHAAPPPKTEARPTRIASPPTSEILSVRGETVYRWQRAQPTANHSPLALPIDCTLLTGDCVLEHQGKRFEAESIFFVVDGLGSSIDVHLLMDKVQIGSGQTTREPIVAHLKLPAPPEIRAHQYRGATEIPEAWWSKCGLSPTPSTTPAATPIASLNEPIPSAVAPVQYVQPVPDGAPNSQSLPPSGLIWDDSGIVTDPTQLGDHLDPPADPVTDYESIYPPPPVTSYAAPDYSDPGYPTLNDPVMPLPEPPILTDDGGTTGGWSYAIDGGTKSIEMLARGASRPIDFSTITRVAENETILIARGGVTVLVRDLTAQTPTGLRVPLGTVSLSANQIIAWTPPIGDIITGAVSAEASDGELYLEGDIVVRQGDQIIYAEAMYYNAAQEVAVVLDAEAIATIPQYQGTVRVKAEVMRQLAKGNFVANNAAVTSSRMGVPRYWLQSNQLSLTQRPVAKMDKATGQVIADTEPYVTSGGNFVYLAGVPVMYWPRFSTPLRKPTFYLTGADIKSDDIFGSQVLLEWDLFQLLGMNAPDGVESILLTDYLSDRGPAIGGRTTYSRTSMFGIAGPVIGTYDSYTIKDDGLDVLGNGRRDLTPEEDLRGRTTLKHRHYLPGNWEFMAELGYLSDRNFLEQYFEQEWDNDPNRATGLRLRKYAGSQLFDASFNVQINDFYQETERLPSLEHYALGGSLLGDRLTLSMHNELGYAKLKVADAPLDPVVAANTSVLPGEFDREGVITRTRQELSMPIQAGVMKLAPFAIGEAAYYGEGVDGNDVTRLWGGGGVRANLPLSRVDPTIQSSLLNVRGLAHKIDLSAEYFYADSDTDYQDLPLYDPLDDHSQQEFRRFFINNTFGGTLADEYDPRNYALRQGIQRNVTSPSDTVVDDLQQLRLGMKHRFQTKRGLPGRERIVDLFRVDIETILFPEEDRDNFGETLGPTIYDAQYNLGDRVTLLSDGYFDWFDGGLRSVSGGVRTSRPGVGDFYIGLLSLEGPISSTVLRTKLDHRLNEKWIISAGNTYDFGETGNVGQSFGLTRIGESFLVQVGANVDAGRDNTSFGFLVEPRFLPSSRLGRLGGQLIPPPGVEGIE